MPTDTIDAIKRRMIQNASKLWGYQDVQDINSFDPVLSLLIGALAEELHNVSREINKSDARVVEKLLELLFSQNIFTHFPAHAIAMAKPQQARVEINEFYQFYAQKNISVKDNKEGQVEKKDIFFTPTTGQTLFNGEIKYLYSGKYFYEVDGQFKEILAEKPHGSVFSNTKLILGLKLDALVEKLDGLPLFFSFKNLQAEDRFYHLLQSAKCKINGKDVIFEKGLISPNANQNNSIFEIIERDSNITNKSNSYINDFYNKKFLTLGTHSFLDKEFIHENYNPNILNEFLSNEKLKISTDEILWLELDLSQPLSSEDVSNLFVSINCFPIVNRELIENTFSINKGINIIPLLTEDLFFDIKDVSDSKSTKYIPKSSVSSDNGHQTYVLRQGGIARFDSRDARETVTNLIGVVRDEAAAFSAKGADLVSSELKQLDQILSRLQQRINKANVANDLNTYLLLESKSNYDKIFVQFWSILGDVANNLRPGTKLSLYNGIDLEDKNISLITPSVGGRQKLSKEDKLNTLRRALLSKGRIVTVEDIKALCFEQFGNDLKKVEVKKGVALDAAVEKGLCRTLDIYLTLKSSSKLSEEDLWHRKEGLKIRLKQESINLMPYRVLMV